MALLDPLLLTRLERLQLGTRRRLAGQFSGEHRSRRHGSSLDFADYREYNPGDDFRRIDYHLYARLDVLLMKLFDADDEVHLRLMVDTSASMAAEGKLEQAKRIAAVLGFVSLLRRDPVSLHAFPGFVPGPRYNGRHATAALFAHLERLRPDGVTNFLEAATHVIGRPGAPGLTAVISDLLTDEWESALRRLPARGGDVVVIHVLAASDLHPDLLGDLDLVDAEHGERLSASIDPQVIRDYVDHAGRWCEQVETLCRHAGAGYARVMAHDAIDSTLLAGWQHAGVLR